MSEITKQANIIVNTIFIASMLNLKATYAIAAGILLLLDVPSGRSP